LLSAFNGRRTDAVKAKTAPRVKARKKIVGVRFHDDEYRDVESHAKKIGLEPSTWLRNLAVATARQA
jgi:hypothetical protein